MTFILTACCQQWLTHSMQFHIHLDLVCNSLAKQTNVVQESAAKTILKKTWIVQYSLQRTRSSSQRAIIMANHDSKCVCQLWKMIAIKNSFMHGIIITGSYMLLSQQCSSNAPTVLRVQARTAVTSLLTDEKHTSHYIMIQ